MMNRAIKLLGLGCTIYLLSACASPRGASAKTKSNKPARTVVPPNSPEVRTAIKQAAVLGMEIAIRDSLAARASDALLAKQKGRRDSRLRGWITSQRNGQWLVRFVGKTPSGIAALYDIAFDKQTQKLQGVETLDTPAVLSASETARFAARLTATRSLGRVCSRRHNVVVLPAEALGKKGWLVYVLAATITPRLLVAGGHQRVHVSPDGLKVLERFHFTKSCLNVPLHGVAKTPYFSHIVAPWPQEIHVFLSILHKTPLFIITRSGPWLVAGPKIRFAGKGKKH